MKYEITDTIIVINSSKRSTDMITYEMFPDKVINWVVAVPHDEYKLYSKVLGVNRVQQIPDSIPHCLSDQRQWVIEHYTILGYKFIWFMDDDLKYLRRVDGTTKLKKVNVSDMHEMFLYMRHQMNTHPYVGVSARFGNNNIDDFLDITRVYQSYIINTEIFKKVGAVFNPIPMFLGQDTHMSLCFLNAGYKTRVIGKYAFTEKSSAPGGCAVYRDATLARRCAIWLMDNHPEVTLKTKFTKTGWGLAETKDGRRYKVDFTIQWKKAYKPIKTKPTGGLMDRIRSRNV